MIKASDIIKNNKDHAETLKKDKELVLHQYKSQKLNEMIQEKTFGGYECKMENGKLVHFKYWGSKKL